ncbi:MAG TPA: SurA N-terminal domain-containing protein [Chthoniobacterales bacterium]|nr:SurA N-terminal domain-containing protein [Chthoniobacterales bacterium]
MINVMRKNQRILWIVIAFLAIPFVFYFQNDILNFEEQNQLGELYGRPVTNVEFQRNARLFNLAQQLGMFTLMQDLVAGAQSQDEAYVEFTFNRLILREQAERLGIKPSTQEIANVVRGLRPFRGEKDFDPAKYNEFAQTTLPAMGFTEGDIEELARDQISFARLKEIVGSGVQVPEAESRENYERAYGKLSVSVVRLQSDAVAKDVPISDEEITNYFEANQAQLKTDDKRKVSFVTLGLNEEEKKLEPKQRVEVLQKRADRVTEFSQALLEQGANFQQVAAKFELPVQTTGDFTKTAPDPLLATNPQLSAAAFRLTQEEPTSDVIQAGDAFYILHLSGMEPARPLTLEEARPKIVETLKTQKQSEMLTARATEITNKIREAMNAGTPIEAAAQQAGVAVEKVPPFALSDPPKPKPAPDQPAPPETADLQSIKGAVSELSAGEISAFTPTQNGGLIAIVEKRDPADPAGYEAGKAMFAQRYVRSKREIAFFEWLRERREEAGVKSAPPEQQPVTAG